jgi:hypothetical protein
MLWIPIIVLIGVAIVAHYVYLEVWHSKLDVKTPCFYKQCKDVHYVVSKDYDGWSIYNYVTLLYRRGVHDEYLFPATNYWYYLSFIL